jgi:2-C-methyl-D-erythritol 4-phosphate cytidylyltransferase
MASLRKIALIVAAGSSSRMGMITPKQFHPLGGIPLAVHPGLKFRAAFPDIELVYAIASGTAQIWESLLSEFFPEGNWRLCMGGKSRYESVQNGIRSMKDEAALVAVHDGARPFIRPEEIQFAFRMAEDKGNAVFAVYVKDSLRRVHADGTSTFLERNEIMQVQTPQIFQLESMRAAYEAEPDQRFTDDATVMELAGYPVFLCNGSYENIKITTPEDWLIAENILQQQKASISGGEV